VPYLSALEVSVSRQGAIQIYDYFLANVNVNTKRVVKYCDFGPIESYISETVQDGR